MRPGQIIIALFAVIASVSMLPAQTALDKAARDDVFSIPNDDPEMAAAMRQARATLADFLALARAPPQSMKNFSVKIGLRADLGGYEFVWVRPFTSKGDQFSGQLRNTPRRIKRLKLGDTIRFVQNDIVDWTYSDGTRTKGNFTACALLKREPRRDAEAFVRRYGLECNF
jgi:uncharacterized protein YegJ (DUF2314 family)